jgi:GMP synthase-like glutamine amidotransferase
MGRAIVLQHVEHVGPGRIVPVFRDFGIPLEIRRLWRGDEVPTDLDEVRVLIILGGGPSLADTTSDTRGKAPYLATEVQTVQRLVAADRAVLGINFGAQLLALAAGAKVYQNVRPPTKPEDPPTPAPELGWGPVTFPFPGGTEPIVFGLSDGTPMFHWHTETFDVPKLPSPANPPPPPAPPPPTGNALLSSTRACKNQAFRFKTRLFGFQYHFELTPEDIEKFITYDSDFVVRAAGGSDAVARIRDDTARLYPRYARLGNRILENFVEFLKTY